MAKEKSNNQNCADGKKIKLSKTYPSTVINETKLKNYIEKNGTKR